MTAATAIVVVVGAFLSIASMFLLYCRLRRLPQAEGEAGVIKVSVVIPARNEEGNLARLLPSLNKQWLAPHEVIVVDDQSTDGTHQVAEELGARVMSGQALPDEWYGKPWACHQGAGASSGDWLLFLDADLELEPDALERLVRLAHEAPEAVVSVCPWHRIEKPYEELSVFFNLLMLGGIGAFTWQGDGAKGIGLFGQLMMLSKANYQRIGGHEAVKTTVLENFHLSKRCEDLGVPRRCFGGKGVVSMRMFPGGFKELVDSWAKGFSSGAGLTSAMALLLSSVWLTGLMMLSVCVFLMMFGQGGLAVSLAYLAVAVPMIWLFRQAGGFSPLNALLFPLSLFFYQGLFAVAVMKKRSKVPTQWKGRNVD